MALAGTLLSLSVVNMPQFLKATLEAPQLQLKYMRSELNRGVKRIRKNFIRTQLHGPPGITAGKLAKGKNIFTFVSGKSLPQLGAKIGISRILHVHEKGLTIRPKEGGLLYLHEKGAGPVPDRPIFAAVPQVVIPARLKFRQQVQNETPAMLVKVAKAGSRATEVTFKKAIGGHG